MTLAGHLDPRHPLSPRSAFRHLGQLARQAVEIEPASLWELDTKMLPSALQQYRRRVRDYANRVIVPVAQTLDQQPEGQLLEELKVQLAKDGWLTDFLPPPLGTMPLRIVSKAPLAVAIKLEEMAAACAGVALIVGAHGLGLLPVFLSGDLGLVRKRVLPAFVDSRKGRPIFFSYALTEPSAGSDVEDSLGASRYRPGTVARRVHNGWLLNGRKQFISGGDHAAWISVFAALDGEDMQSTTCFLVDASSDGFECVRTELKMGQRASHAAELSFSDVFVPDDHVVGGLSRGWALNRAILNVSRVPVAALCLGIARGVMERSVQWLCTQKVAGERLADRQEVQLGIAQMMVDVSAMRAMVWQTASQRRASQTRSSVAKVFCSDMAVKVCQDAMHLVGEAGVGADGSIGKAFRDARLTQIYEGTNQINRLAIIEDQMEWLLSQCESGATYSPDG